MITYYYDSADPEVGHWGHFEAESDAEALRKLPGFADLLYCEEKSEEGFSFRTVWERR